MRTAGLARNAILAAIVAAPIGPAGAAEGPWLEVRSPHFAVVSNPSEAAYAGYANDGETRACATFETN